MKHFKNIDTRIYSSRKTPSFLNNFFTAFLIWLIGGLPTLAFALPQGEQVVSGEATFTRPDGSTFNVNQTTEQLIATFNSFNIGQTETVNVFQPSANAIALFKVLGIDPSIILGALNADGQVILQNGSGVFFGAGANVDVHGLIPTTLNISNQDFLDRNYKFTQDLNLPLASVINEGTISATSYVGLLGSAVENRGEIIVASLGSVDLAAGKSATLDFTGDGLINFEVTEAVSGTVTDKDGKVMLDRVSNTGLIQANGGQVRMTAKDAGDVIRHVVNMTGVIEANTVVEKQGKIFLSGGDKGIVSVTGELSASGDDAGEQGGIVNVLGEFVGLFDNAKVDVSGDTGGGTALIGGDFQGKNAEVQNAYRTYVGEDVEINANAITSGDGGKVIVWADDVTRVYGTALAKAGSAGGDGGFIEISGKESLVFRGSVDASSIYGAKGTVLFDPKNIIIANGGNDSGPTTSAFTIAFTTSSGSDLTFDADQITQATNLGNNVVLQAGNDITISEAIITNNTSGTGGALTLQAERSVIINANITTDGGAFTVTSNNSTSSSGDRDSGSAQLTMADGVTINAGSGDIQLNMSTGPASGEPSGNITVANLTTTGDVFIKYNGVTAGGAIVRASAASLITANSLAMDLDTTSGISGSIGTANALIRVQVNNLDAHTHNGVSGVYVQALGDVTVGGSAFASGFSFKGIQTGVNSNTGGDIVLKATGNITNGDNIKATSSGNVTIEADSDLSGSGDFINLGDGLVQTSSGNISITAVAISNSGSISTSSGTITETIRSGSTSEVDQGTNSTFLEDFIGSQGAC